MSQENAAQTVEIQSRIQLNDIEPAAFQAMLGLEGYLNDSGLDSTLKSLIKIKASMINKCAFCIEMHSDHAQKHGETVPRMLAVAAWEESPLFSERERVVLALTEELTRVSIEGLTDTTYKKSLEMLGEKTLMQCIMQVATINTWNRIALATKMVYSGS